MAPSSAPIAWGGLSQLAVWRDRRRMGPIVVSVGVLVMLTILIIRLPPILLDAFFAISLAASLMMRSQPPPPADRCRYATDQGTQSWSTGTNTIRLLSWRIALARSTI